MCDAPPLSPCPEQFNLADYVLGAARRSPERSALEVFGKSGSTNWTYGALLTAVLGTASGFAERGAPGDVVVLRLGNTPDFPIAFLGAIAAGFIPVPTSSQLTKREITAIAGQTRAKLVVAAPGLTTPDTGEPVIAQDEFRSWRDYPAAKPIMGSPDRPAYVIFTSGTSGQPRAVVHAHRAVWARRMMWAGWEGLRATDRLLHAGAFNWTYTLGTGLMDPWARGATALIPAEGTAPSALPQLLAHYQATIFAAAPGVYRQMLRSPFPVLPALRHGLSAGEKLSDELRQRWREATETDLHEAYGMSECSTFISGCPKVPAPPGSLGRVQPGRQITLRNKSQEVAPDQIGEIAIHRDDPGLMLGYLNHPKDTAARYDGDWFLTGDLARRDPYGVLYYEGRRDDMMNAGGYRVSPLEVEQALTSHPAVQDAAALELRVKREATVIGAFYTLAEGATDPGTKALEDYLADRLARYKCPRVFELCKDLPRTANHKLNRRALRAAWEASHGHA